MRADVELVHLHAPAREPKAVALPCHDLAARVHDLELWPEASDVSRRPLAPMPVMGSVASSR